MKHLSFRIVLGSLLAVQVLLLAVMQTIVKTVANSSSKDTMVTQFLTIWSVALLASVAVGIVYIALVSLRKMSPDRWTIICMILIALSCTWATHIQYW